METSPYTLPLMTEEETGHGSHQESMPLHQTPGRNRLSHTYPLQGIALNGY